MVNFLTRRSSTRPVVVALAVLILGAGLAPAAFAQTQLVGSGQAFGSQVSLEGLISSERSGNVGMGCSTAPLSKSNSVAGVDASPVLTTGAVNTTATRVHLNGGSTIRSRTTAEIAGVDILGGVVSVSAIFANAVAELTPEGFKARGFGSELANLSVLGIPIIITPPPNTTIDLLGLGFVKLNEQDSNVRPNGSRHQTRMVHVVISLPNPLVPVGTEIIIGSAQAAMHNSSVLLGGGAFGASIEVGGLVLLDKMFNQGMPCPGTGGEVRSNGGVGLGLPGILTNATVLSTVQGDSTPTSVQAIATSTVEDVDVLLGLASVGLIKAKAAIEGTPQNFTRKIAGSQFADLQILNFPAIEDNVPMNTRLDILGLGDLWLKRRIIKPTSVQVRMIQLLVLENNVLGLPVGADLRVAQAGVNLRDV